MSAAMKVLVNSRIVVEHILKFIEMVLKCENDFEISESLEGQEISLQEKSNTETVAKRARKNRHTAVSSTMKK